VLDRRYRETELATHDERHFPAEALAEAAEITARAGGRGVMRGGRGAIFRPGLVDVVLRLRDAGKRIIIAGDRLQRLGAGFSSRFQY